MLIDRYLTKQMLKSLCLLLLGLFSGYIIIDYSTHASDFWIDKTFSLSRFLLYYAAHFVVRLPFLLPLAFLMTLMLTLGTMNRRGELIALLSSGLSTRRLLKMPLRISLSLAICSILSFQMLYPSARLSLERFERAEKEKLAAHPGQLQVHLLSDKTQLIYVQSPKEKNTLKDVYWIRSDREIVHYPQIREGLLTLGDQLIYCDATQSFEKRDNIRSDELTPLLKKRISLNESPVEHISIIRLFQALARGDWVDKFTVSLNILYKLFLPFAPLLLLWIFAPLFMHKEMREKLGWIFSLSMLAFIVLFSIINVCLVIAGGSMLLVSLLLGSISLLTYMATKYSWKHA